MANKKIFWSGIVFIFLGLLVVRPVQAQEVNIPGSEAVWETVKGVISDPWAIFEPLEGFRPAGLDLYGWTQNTRNFIGEFQNALTMSPSEVFNFVLGKTSGIVWLDALAGFIKELIQKVISNN